MYFFLIVEIFFLNHASEALKYKQDNRNLGFSASKFYVLISITNVIDILNPEIYSGHASKTCRVIKLNLDY